jgi:hypothetical protein
MNGSVQQSLVNREERLPEQEWRGGRGELRAIEAIEVTPLEDRQGQFKNPCFPCLKFKILATFRRRTAGVKLLFARFDRAWMLDHYPGPAFRAGNARARNTISHFSIILR